MKGFPPKYLTSYLQLYKYPVYQTRSAAKNIGKRLSREELTLIIHFSHAALKNGDIKLLPSPISFKKTLLSFVKISENSVFVIHDNNGINTNAKHK